MTVMLNEQLHRKVKDHGRAELDLALRPHRGTGQGHPRKERLPGLLAGFDTDS